MKNKIVAWTFWLLLIAELMLVFGSWLLSATMTADVRSLLSYEGVRWLCGQYTAVVLSPVLSWLLLAGMAFGAVVRSDVLGVCRHPVNYRERFALRVAAVALLVYVAVVVWMVLSPQALLLSATGHLWPSPFSRSLVPLVSLGAVLVSACYGGLTRTFSSPSVFAQSLVWGLERVAPLLLIYVMAVQFYESLRWVFL